MAEAAITRTDISKINLIIDRCHHKDCTPITLVHLKLASLRNFK